VGRLVGRGVGAHGTPRAGAWGGRGPWLERERRHLAAWVGWDAWDGEWGVALDRGRVEPGSGRSVRESGVESDCGLESDGVPHRAHAPLAQAQTPRTTRPLASTRAHHAPSHGATRPRSNATPKPPSHASRPTHAARCPRSRSSQGLLPTTPYAASHSRPLPLQSLQSKKPNGHPVGLSLSRSSPHSPPSPPPLNLCAVRDSGELPQV
jgi:hypothetical protein